MVSTDHANVACGFHAGDPLIMQETVRTYAIIAKEESVKAKGSTD